MKIFIDSADLAEVKKYMDWGLCDGVTTNPSIFLKAGIRGGVESIKIRAQALAQLIHPLPLSVEVTSDDIQEIMRQAREYATWAPNIAVKVTITDHNGNSLLPVIRQLASEGVVVNVTAMMTFNQTILAAKALDAGYRAYPQSRKRGYISIFAGRVSEEHGVEQAFRVVENVRSWLDKHVIESSEIIVGSVRSAENVEYWARSGAHILTIPPDTLSKLLQSARTKETVAQFLDDAKKSMSELGTPAQPPQPVHALPPAPVAHPTNKILPLKVLQERVEELKKQGKKIVTTNGAFDILHVGHKRALEASKKLGDILIVGVNSDESVRQYKSPLRPIVGEFDRAEMLAGLASVDYVTIFEETDPRNFLEALKPHVHTKSGDYQADKLKETETVRANGGEIVIVPFVDGKSTTQIIEDIRAQDEHESPTAQV